MGLALLAKLVERAHVTIGGAFDSVLTPLGIGADVPNETAQLAGPPHQAVDGYGGDVATESCLAITPTTIADRGAKAPILCCASEGDTYFTTRIAPIFRVRLPALEACTMIRQ